jgi:hypothetical protein
LNLKYLKNHLNQSLKKNQLYLKFRLNLKYLMCLKYQKILIDLKPQKHPLYQ